MFLLLVAVSCVVFAFVLRYVFPGWTAAQIPDHTGRIAVVTGTTIGGLGFETAFELARAGATVVLTARNPQRGREAAELLKSRLKECKREARVDVIVLDLCSLASVRSFAAAFKRQYEELHLLINNAGVMALPQRETTADGFETQLGTNHLGHMLLTAELMGPLLAATAKTPQRPARIVNVSSVAAYFGQIAFDDLMGERKYNPWKNYGQSKLANLLFTRELNRRLRAQDSPLIVVASHPGYTATNLQRHQSAARACNNFMAQSVQNGALPTLFAACAPNVKPGAWYGPRCIAWFGSPNQSGAFQPKAALDKAAARRLWDVSVKLTKANFVFSNQ